MPEPQSTIKEGSIVLYISNSDNSSSGIIYYCVGKVGAQAYDPNRWLVTFSRLSFNCHASELIWLMDLPEDKRDKNFREVITELMPAILAATLHQLRDRQLRLINAVDEALASQGHK